MSNNPMFLSEASLLLNGQVDLEWCCKWWTHHEKMVTAHWKRRKIHENAVGFFAKDWCRTSLVVSSCCADLQERGGAAVRGVDSTLRLTRSWSSGITGLQRQTDDTATGPATWIRLCLRCVPISSVLLKNGLDRRLVLNARMSSLHVHIDLTLARCCCCCYPSDIEVAI